MNQVQKLASICKSTLSFGPERSQRVFAAFGRNRTVLVQTCSLLTEPGQGLTVQVFSMTADFMAD